MQRSFREAVNAYVTSATSDSADVEADLHRCEGGVTVTAFQ